MKKCVIIAGGDMPQGKLVDNVIQNADFVICADSGANHLFSLGVEPSVLVGDFDSISSEAMAYFKAKGIACYEHPKEKDETDTELALSLALQQGCEEISLLAAMGGRVDHSLANLFLLFSASFAQKAGERARIKLIGQDFGAFRARKEENIKRAEGSLVSLVPIAAPVKGITLTGFKYPLQEETLPLGSTRGISNVLLEEEGKILHKEGQLLIVQSYV